MTTEDAMRNAVSALWNCARRYCDGRSTHISSTYNRWTRALLEAGVPFETPDGTPWARDRYGRTYDGLTDEEAALGLPAPPAFTREDNPEREAHKQLVEAVALFFSDGLASHKLGCASPQGESCNCGLIAMHEALHGLRNPVP